MFKIDEHFCYGRGYAYWGGGYNFLYFFGFVQGVRLLGKGTQIFFTKSCWGYVYQGGYAYQALHSIELCTLLKTRSQDTMTKFNLNLGATLLPTEASDNLKRPGKGTNQIYRTDLHIILVNLKHVSRCLSSCAGLFVCVERYLRF